MAAEQAHLPYELTLTFDSDAASDITELMRFYSLSPEQLAVYGIGVLLLLKKRTEEEHSEQHIFVGESHEDNHKQMIVSPTEYFNGIR
jgi:hypothetical protein